MSRLQIIEDWLALCSGKRDFDKYHFTMLFHDGIRVEDLPEIFASFGAASPELVRRTAIALGAKYMTPEDVIHHEADASKFSQADFYQMTKIIDQFSGNRHVWKKAYQLRLEDEKKFYERLRENGGKYLDDEIYEVVSDNFLHFDSVSLCLGEAFYGIANNYRLQHALLEPTWGTGSRFENYLNLWGCGFDYDVRGEEIVISRNYLVVQSKEWRG